jgi:hypothetical protein
MTERRAGLIVAIVIVLFGCDDKRQKNEHAGSAAPVVIPTTPEAARPPTVAPPIEVTGKQLYEDYEQGKDAADAKYRDKTVRLHGIVKDKGTTVLQITAPHQDHINAWFGDSDAKALKPLRPYQEVFVRCRGDYMLDVPTLRDCVLEQVVPEK